MFGTHYVRDRSVSLIRITFRALGAFILGLFVFTVGAVSTSLGIVKSNKLERVRVLVRRQNVTSEAVFSSFARLNPSLGMTGDEFNMLCGQVSGITFRPDEMVYIMNAVCESGLQVVTLKDFHEWVAGNVGMML